jgi:outer membrane lipoprotein carrier protein
LINVNHPLDNSRSFFAFQQKSISKNMKKLLFALVALFAANLLQAQSGLAKPEKDDPEAKKVLDKIRKKYEGYKTIEASFSLVLEVPGQPKETQKGTVGQEGDKFRLDMDQQMLVSDGKTTWVFLKKNNEVQINNAEKNGEGDFLTPKDLLKRYQKGDFMYAITDKTTEGGKVLTQVEFKPKDKKSEYSKLRISIDEKSGTIQHIKAFAKDGSRYTFSVAKLTPNKTFDADYFKFETKKYPGIKVEDLRI